jgi:uncharacterized membrane protein
MKIDTFKSTVSAFIIAAIPFVYLAFKWDNLPQKFVLSMSKSEKLISKSQIFEPLIMMAILSLVVYFFMANFNSKTVGEQSKKIIKKFGLMTVAFMSALSIYTIQSSNTLENGSFLFVLMGLFITVLGNLMHSIKPNLVFGFRIPWVFKSEENWRKTHQLASKIWFVGGIFIVFSALLMPSQFMIFALFGSLLIMTLIPTFYSYQLFKNKAN